MTISRIEKKITWAYLAMICSVITLTFMPVLGILSLGYDIVHIHNLKKDLDDEYRKARIK